MPDYRRHRLATILVVMFLAQGCHSAMPDSDSDAKAFGPSKGGYTNLDAAWPLIFKFHNFGGHCFNTQRCEILYRGFPHGNEEPSPSVESYGRPLESLLSAGRGPIPNFPDPAKVTWQSKDGTPLQAEIDIGEIFKDQLIRHNVSHEDVSNPPTDGTPDIIIEVNDRTINVYMRGTIWTKQEQIPGNRYSHSRVDLIKAFSRTY